MKKNMGTIDRTIRLLFAIAVAILYLTGSITGVEALILGIIAICCTIITLFHPRFVPVLRSCLPGF